MAREAGPEIAGNPICQRAQPDGLPLGGIADPLESLSHPIQAFGIGGEMVREIRRRSGPGANPFDPTLETGERRAHLVGGFASHCYPETIPLRSHGAAIGEHRHCHHDRDGEALQHREADQVALGRKRSVVHRTHRRIANRRVLPVEASGVQPHPGVVERSLERQVGRGGHPPAAIGHHQGKSQRSHLLAQPQQRLGLGAGPGIVESPEYPGVEPAGSRGVGLEVTEYQKSRCRSSGPPAAPPAPPPFPAPGAEAARYPRGVKRSTPRYGTSTSGTRTDPSGAWLFSSSAMMVRGTQRRTR